MILLQCNDLTLMPMLKIIKNAFLILEIMAPILAIVCLTIVLLKLMINPEDKKKIGNLKNIIISLIIIFLLPTSINVVMIALGEKFSVSSCWNNADKYDFSSFGTYYDGDKKKVKVITENTYELGKASSKKKDAEVSGVAEKIASAAEYYAWPKGTPKSKYCRFNGGGATKQFMSDYRKYWPNFKNSGDRSVAAGTCCCHFARTCVVKGLGKKFSFTLLPGPSKDASLKKNMEKLGFTRIKFDGKYSTLKRGDVLYYRYKGSGGHVWIFLGDHKAAEAAHNSGYGGRITSLSKNKLNTSNKSVYYIFRAVK